MLYSLFCFGITRPVQNESLPKTTSTQRALEQRSSGYVTFLQHTAGQIFDESYTELHCETANKRTFSQTTIENCFSGLFGIQSLEYRRIFRSLVLLFRSIKNHSPRKLFSTIGKCHKCDLLAGICLQGAATKHPVNIMAAACILSVTQAQLQCIWNNFPPEKSEDRGERYMRVQQLFYYSAGILALFCDYQSRAAIVNQDRGQTAQERRIIYLLSNGTILQSQDFTVSGDSKTQNT